MAIRKLKRGHGIAVAVDLQVDGRRWRRLITRKHFPATTQKEVDNAMEKARVVEQRLQASLCGLSHESNNLVSAVEDYKQFALSCIETADLTSAAVDGALYCIGKFEEFVVYTNKRKGTLLAVEDITVEVVESFEWWIYAYRSHTANTAKNILDRFHRMVWYWIAERYTDIDVYLLWKLRVGDSTRVINPKRNRNNKQKKQTSSVIVDSTAERSARMSALLRNCGML